jgi:hypothetical protein
MKVVLPTLIFGLTAALVALGTLGPSQLGTTVGVASGSALPGLTPSASTPEQAISAFLTQVRKRNWRIAYLQLANQSNVDDSLFVRELTGGNGSLRTFSGLQDWELQPLHATNDEANVRVTLHWSTPVGLISEVRDLKVVRQGDVWKVDWPVPHFPNVPAQVIPVNYLRWDLVGPGPNEEWGDRNVDAPHVRIVSMNAIDYDGGSVVMGEVVNEDTVPAFVNVNATLLDANGSAIDEESSFDKISHVLLPKQVSPYRIDFPAISLERVKNVRMDAKATLVPASADPVIGVISQKLDTDPQSRALLRGELLNQSGQVVGIPHVIASFYDNNGKVIWVSDGYVDRALLPQTPEPFAVQIPKAVAGKVQNYHVLVNQYTLGAS